MAKTRFVIVFVFLARICSSQDYRNEVLAASGNLVKQRNYSMTIDYKVFLDDDLSKPFQERQVYIRRRDKCVAVVQSSGLELLDNEHYQVMVDPTKKIFSARKKFKEEDIYGARDQLQGVVQSSVDSMLIFYTSIKVIQNSGSTVRYEVRYKDDMALEKSILSINKKTMMYESVLMYFRQPRKVHELNNTSHKVALKVSYQNFKKNGAADPKVFDEKQYLNINSKGQIVPAKKYSGYKLIIPEDEI